jgi:hypothetical protein
VTLPALRRQLAAAPGALEASSKASSWSYPLKWDTLSFYGFTNRPHGDAAWVCRSISGARGGEVLAI